jgi:glyoxylase-like metal-dependent hydrolase (beta-lactamase superfamily II)
MNIPILLGRALIGPSIHEGEDMKYYNLLGVAMVLGLSACSQDSGNDSPQAMTPERAQTAATIEEVADAMGLAGVDSLSITGTAWRIRNSFRQTLTASPPWPEHDEITNWVQTIDLESPAMLGQGDTFSSNLFLEPPVAGTHINNVPVGSTSWGRQLEIWLTPWGFVKGAQNAGSQGELMTMDGESYTRFSWQTGDDMVSPSGMHYTVNGYANSDNLIVRTETWVEDAFMGDMHVVGVYADYQDFDGLMVPATFEQQRGGGGIFGVQVASAQANPVNLEALLTAPPANAPNFGGGGDRPDDLTEDLGDGAWLVKGAYVALVVEFSDHLAVVEAGQNEANGELIIQQIRQHISDKEIRYVMNSHPHSDHTGGLPPLIREGAALVTHEKNVAFMDMALNTPRTLLGEEDLNARVIGVEGVGIYEDVMNRLELHPVPNLHTEGMLVAVLPKQGVMFEADFTLPQPGREANPFVKTLARYVRDNDIQFDRYLAVHPAAVPQNRDDLMATIENE